MTDVKMVNLDTANILAKKLRALFPYGCKRVLFVNPVYVPEEDFVIDVALDNRYPVYPPYGFGVLSRELQARGCVTDIIDLNYNLQEVLKNSEAAFGRTSVSERFHYDIWQDMLREKIEEFSPDFIGVTCMFTITYRQMKRTIEFIKAQEHAVPIIAGGVHASQAAEIILRDCLNLDFVALFDGTASFGNLIDFVNNTVTESHITQLASLVDGTFVAIKERSKKTPLNMDGMPHYHELPIGNYSNLGRIGVYYWLFPEGTRASTSLGNIGCRAQCTFCSVRTFNGKGVYERDAAAVVDELEMLHDVYGITHIMWLDDDLLYKDCITLFNEMVRRRLPITWDASNGIIASAMTPEIAHAAYESGCIALSIGIESGNSRILRQVKKPSTVEHFYACADMLKKYPTIFTRGLLMCGFPGETVGMQAETIQLAQRIRLDWHTIQPLNLITGVPITNDALEQGIVTERELIDGTERPFTGSTGGLEKRTRQEKQTAPVFTNYFEGDFQYIPHRADLGDIWFVMDYKVNFEKLWWEYNPIKLSMLRKMFVYIFDKTHRESALGHLYFALIESRLGNKTEAAARLLRARRCADASEYWKARFSALDLFGIAKAIENEN